MTAYQAKIQALKHLRLLNRVHDCYTALIRLGRTEVLCPSGYVATLVLSTYEQRCGIVAEHNHVVWMTERTDCKDLIRTLVGL